MQKHDFYPQNLDEVIDVMRQIPANKPRSQNPKNNGGNDENKNPESELASSLMTKGNNSKDGDGPACYCCDNPQCRLE